MPAQPSYSDTLRDPRWQRRRLEEMQRASFACECCQASHRELHIHHLMYRGEPWEVPAGWLEVLCNRCHHWREAWNRLNGRSFASTRTLMDDERTARTRSVWAAREEYLREHGRAEYMHFRRRQRAAQRKFAAYTAELGCPVTFSTVGARRCR